MTEAQSPANPVTSALLSAGLKKVQIKKGKSEIQELFSNTKKLPAMTSQKHGQTQRIFFHRRKDMWKKNLVIINFTDIIGIVEEQ